MTTRRWNLDPAHSEVGFRVKHMMLTTVSGKFQDFEGWIETASDAFDDAEMHFSADVSSLSTANEERDLHLLSPDFFDAARFPKITFASTGLTRRGEQHFSLSGRLAMHGNEKELRLDLLFEGINKDPWGNLRAGFNLVGKLNRKDWGLNWNSLLEAGGVMVGEEVTLVVGLQFIKT